MLTISDIYKDDLPDDSIFVLEYPSSHKDNIGNPMFLVNSSRYLVSSDNRRSPAYWVINENYSFSKLIVKYVVVFLFFCVYCYFVLIYICVESFHVIHAKY